MKKSHLPGFTILELSVVIGIVAVLTAILVPTLIGRLEASRTARAISDVSEIAKAIARIRADTSVSGAGCVDRTSNLTDTTVPPACVPSTSLLSNFPTCKQAVVGVACWGGPYIPSVPIDPWGNNYYATLNTSNFTVTIGSEGPDGTTGDTDDDTYVQ